MWPGHIMLFVARMQVARQNDFDFYDAGRRAESPMNRSWGAHAMDRAVMRNVGGPPVVSSNPLIPN